MVKLGSVAVLALVATASSAFAGGFALREQSVESQGASFAGSAAFGGLSSMFWNPSAAANKDGFNTESNFAFIVPNAQNTITSATGSTPGRQTALDALGADSGNMSKKAVVPASYLSYQFKNYDPNLFLGLGINSPFGAVTEPGKYKGEFLGRTADFFSVNLNPNIAYRVAPGLTVGVGMQVMYASGELKFASYLSPLAPTVNPSTGFKGTDISVGATAGVTYKPVEGTTIGLGYRSRITSHLSGNYYTNASILNPTLSQSASVDIKLPDIVTLSFKQAITQQVRVMGTVEWSNWSRFDEMRIKSQTGSTLNVIDSKWSDGYFFSLGGEYDVSNTLTVRTGVAYEISPVDDPTKRLSGLPDSNRIWASLGGTYKWSESLAVDLAYTHIFLKDETLVRTTQGMTFQGDVKAKTDILSVALKHKW
jgi:long-chain fatty acid transport protein